MMMRRIYSFSTERDLFVFNDTTDDTLLKRIHGGGFMRWWRRIYGGKRRIYSYSTILQVILQAVSEFNGAVKKKVLGH